MCAYDSDVRRGDENLECRAPALPLRMRAAWETLKSGSDSLVNERWAKLRPGLKTVMPLPVAEKEAKAASGRVGLHRITGEAMAFDEHFIDFVNCFPAVAGRMARPERRLELQAWHLLPPEPPAGQTPGLARQIIKCQLEGLEPAAEAFGAHEAIGRRSGIGQGLGCCPHCRHPGIAPEDMDARRIPRECSAAQGLEIFPRIEELEGGTGTPTLPDRPRRHGPRGYKLHHKAARRDHHKAAHGGFGRPQQAQHGAVEGLRNPRNRGFA